MLPLPTRVTPSWLSAIPPTDRDAVGQRLRMAQRFARRRRWLTALQRLGLRRRAAASPRTCRVSPQAA